MQNVDTAMKRLKITIDPKTPKNSIKVMLTSSPGAAKRAYEKYNTDVVVIVSGNTYPVKEELKKAGFKWDPEFRAWIYPVKSLDDIVHALEVVCSLPVDEMYYVVTDVYIDRLRHHVHNLAALEIAHMLLVHFAKKATDEDIVSKAREIENVIAKYFEV